MNTIYDILKMKTPRRLNVKERKDCRNEKLISLKRLKENNKGKIKGKSWFGKEEEEVKGEVTGWIKYFTEDAR